MLLVKGTFQKNEPNYLTIILGKIKCKKLKCLCVRLTFQDMGKNIEIGFFSKEKHWNMMYGIGIFFQTPFENSISGSWKLLEFYRQNPARTLWKEGVEF